MPIITVTQSQANERTPVETFQEFYKAIQNKDCKRATSLRPGYSEENCKNIDSIQSAESDQLKIDDRHAILFAVIEYKKSDQIAQKFNGYILLMRRKGNWIIATSSYKRRTDSFQLKQYLLWIDQHYDPNGTRVRQAAEIKSQTGFQTDETNPLTVEKILKSKDPNRIPEKNDNQNQTTLSKKTESTSPRNPAKNLKAGPTVRLWQNNGPTTYGSRQLLSNCWTPAQLKGKPGEKKTRKTGPGAYLKKPVRARPRVNIAPVPSRYAKSIRRVDTGGRKLVALTFDTGEQNNDYAGYDGEIIDYLRRHNIKATFYFGGKWLATHEERGMQLIADPNFEMGNHAWTHGNLRVIKGKGVRDQVLFTQAQYEVALEKLLQRPCARNLSEQEIEKIPLMVPTFRYPYGTCSKESLQAVNDMGLPAIQWDVVTSDPVRRQSAKAIANIVLKKTKPGSIIIMHSNGRGWNTGKALPMFIPKLKQRGYKFVTVSELLRAGKPYATNTCFELRKGDNLRYDKIFGKGTGD